MTAFVRTDDVAAIKERIDHPVIDGDGHLLEVMPVVFDIVRETADEEVVRRLQRFNRARFTENEGFVPVRVFNGLPAENTYDRMTVTLPKLLYARLDEIGIDFALLYPSFGLTILGYPDDEVRQATARALNRYYAETFAEFRDRLEPVAVIPTFTPNEAVAELRHAVGELGLKAVVMNGVIPRPGRPDDHLSGYLWLSCASSFRHPNHSAVELDVAAGVGKTVGSRNRICGHTCGPPARNAHQPAVTACERSSSSGADRARRHASSSDHFQHLC